MACGAGRAPPPCDCSPPCVVNSMVIQHRNLKSPRLLSGWVWIAARADWTTMPLFRIHKVEYIRRTNTRRGLAGPRRYPCTRHRKQRCPEKGGPGACSVPIGDDGRVRNLQGSRGKRASSCKRNDAAVDSARAAADRQSVRGRGGRRRPQLSGSRERRASLPLVVWRGRSSARQLPACRRAQRPDGDLPRDRIRRRARPSVIEPSTV